MKNAKRLIGFTALTCVFVCTLFSFVPEGCANGDVSADVPVPPAEKRTVRRAPIKKPAVKRKKTTRPRVRKPPAVPQPTSLERGRGLLEQERYMQARPWLQKAVQEERRNPWAWYWYGVVHERMGEFQQAQFFYTKALELDPLLPPLSRVVTWPDDGERKPLWDPLRPARVYPIPTSDHGVTIIPPDAPEAAVRPGRPAVDPEMPKAPIYVPPEPSATQNDATQPPVYVPPPPPEFEEEQE
ncbi:MAG: tetratricopeptide repeat protein [Synergistaceae bacterium]|nr:tetratricopeptide repeat protein [Synergistaceae bacterium]